MNTTTPADGTYTFRTHPYAAPTVARFEGGKLTAYTYGGEAQPVTDLATAQIAHVLTYLDGVTFAPLVPPTIGKARAARLHRLMARYGVPSGEHYGFAGAALDRPVYSLAALTEEDARAVWRFLQATHSAVA